MALNTLKCNHLTPLSFKWLIAALFVPLSYFSHCTSDVFMSHIYTCDISSVESIVVNELAYHRVGVTPTVRDCDCCGLDLPRCH